MHGGRRNHECNPRKTFPYPDFQCVQLRDPPAKYERVAVAHPPSFAIIHNTDDEPSSYSASQALLGFVNIVLYKPDLERLQQILQHKTGKPNDDDLLTHDWREEVMRADR